MYLWMNVTKKILYIFISKSSLHLWSEGNNNVVAEFDLQH